MHNVFEPQGPLVKLLEYLVPQYLHQSYINIFLPSCKFHNQIHEWELYPVIHTSSVHSYLLMAPSLACDHLLFLLYLKHLRCKSLCCSFLFYNYEMHLIFFQAFLFLIFTFIFNFITIPSFSHSFTSLMIPFSMKLN